MADDHVSQGLMALVCLTCGNEKHFEGAPPATLTCEKCSGTVFRSSYVPIAGDDAAISQLEQTARGVALDGGSFDVSEDDLSDLDSA